MKAKSALHTHDLKPACFRSQQLVTPFEVVADDGVDYDRLIRLLALYCSLKHSRIIA